MMINQRQAKKHLGAVFLLCCYFVSILSFVVADYHRALHLEVHCDLDPNQCAKDVCHLAMVHHDFKKGCHHKAHLSNKEQSCVCKDLKYVVQISDLPHYLYTFDYRFSLSIHFFLNKEIISRNIYFDNKGPPHFA